MTFPLNRTPFHFATAALISASVNGRTRMARTAPVVRQLDIRIRPANYR